MNLFINNVFKQGYLAGAILMEISKDRQQEQVDLNLIRDGIHQFIYKGYEGKLNIKKVDG